MTNGGTHTGNAEGRWARIKSLWERVGESLFYLPALFMVAAVVLSQVGVALDRSLDVGDLPPMFDSTVDSSRVLLSVIAGGTITAASVVFSLTLVAVQLASTQFSPRTLGAFLGDRAQQLIIGLVLGTFVYCLLILQVVRVPAGAGSDPFVPRLSVMVAVLLGVASLVAVIASINRTAQSLRIESVAATITAGTIATIEERLGGEEDADPTVASREAVVEPPPEAVRVGAKRAGWIQDIDLEQLMRRVPEGSQVYLHRPIGSFVLRHQVVASVWPRSLEDDARDGVANAFVIGDRRSRHGDIGFGITQLVDIAVRALSPGVNDPKTAEEIVARLGEVLVELAVRELPPLLAEMDGRTLIRGSEPRHADYVELAIEPIRRNARQDPRVLASILSMLATAAEVASSRRGDASVTAFRDQAAIVRNDLGALETPSDRAVVATATEIDLLAKGE